VLGMYRVKTFAEALDKADRLVRLGGFGHTSVLYTDQVKMKDRRQPHCRRSWNYGCH